MSPLTTSSFVALALCLASAVPSAQQPARAAHGHASLTAPASADPGEGGPPNMFGRRVDASGDLVLIADAVAAFPFNHATASFEATNLLSVAGSLGAEVITVLDLAVDGDFAAIMGRRNAEDDLLLVFERVDTGSPTWELEGSFDFLGTGDGTASFKARVEWHDGVLFTVSRSAGGQVLAAVLELPGGGGDPVLLASDATPAATLGDLAAGDAPDTRGAMGPVAAAFSLTAGGNHTVKLWTETPAGSDTWSASDLIVQADAGREFGAALAYRGDEVFVGVPGDDTDGADAGLVEVHGAGFSATGLQQTVGSKNPGDGHRFGRVLDVVDGVLAVSSTQSIYLPGSVDLGVVQIARFDGGWSATGEVFHKFGTTFVDGRDFGADLSLTPGGALLAVGAPGGSLLDGVVSVFDMPPSTWFEGDASPELVGFGGVAPQFCITGGLYADAPLAVQVSDARPSSPGFAILGFGVLNAPFKGGTFYPVPFDIVSVPINPAGTLFLPTTWPADAPLAAPFDIFLQFWVQDPDGILGFASSAGFIAHQL